MTTTYKVKTEHPEKEEYCGTFDVEVHESGRGLTLKYYATGIWGCGKNYDTRYKAIDGLIEASGTKVLKKTIINCI